MAFIWKLLAILLASFLTSSTMNIISAQKLNHPKSTTLLTRLKLDDPQGSGSCWDALYELQSCSGEVVLFFLNGETKLGPNCCNAIRTIEHQCWPNLIGSIGISTEESDVLRGYCDAADKGVGSAGSSRNHYNNLPRLVP